LFVCAAANLALAFGVLVHVLTFVIPNGTINAVNTTLITQLDLKKNK